MKGSSQRMFIGTMFGLLIVIIDSALQGFGDPTNTFIMLFHMFYYISLITIVLLTGKEYRENRDENNPMSSKTYIFQISCFLIIMIDSALQSFVDPKNTFVEVFHYLYYAVIIIFPIVYFKKYYSNKSNKAV